MVFVHKPSTGDVYWPNTHLFMCQYMTECMYKESLCKGMNKPKLQAIYWPYRILKCFVCTLIQLLFTFPYNNPSTHNLILI